MEKSPHGERQSHRGPRDARTLAVRLVAGAVLIPIVLLVNHAGGLVFTLFVCAVAGWGSYEFYRMFASRGVSPSVTIGVLGSVCICLSFHFGSYHVAGMVVTGIFGVILLERLFRREREGYVSGAGITVVGMIYTGWLLGHFIMLRLLAPGSGSQAGAGLQGSGEHYVYVVLALTWTYDSVAYLVGSYFGRHRMFGRVSPSKTVEGSVGGLAGCVCAALVSRATFASFMGLGEAILIGLALGIAAQAGDLVESLMKRSTGTKDSSHAIPGHGGIMDRFDSLLFTGPTFYFYLRAVAAWRG